MCCDSDERMRVRELIGGHSCDEPLLASWTVARWCDEIVRALTDCRIPVAMVADLADHQTLLRMRELWAMFTLPQGYAAETIHAPITWDGAPLSLRRAPLWMEHTYEVVVDELGMETRRVRRLPDAHVLC